MPPSSSLRGKLLKVGDQVSGLLHTHTEPPQILYDIEYDAGHIGKLFCKLTVPSSSKPSTTATSRGTLASKPDGDERKLIRRAQEPINRVFSSVNQCHSLDQSTFVRELEKAFQLSDLQYSLSLDEGPGSFRQREHLNPWDEFRLSKNPLSHKYKSSWRQAESAGSWVWRHPIVANNDIEVTKSQEGEDVVLRWWTGIEVWGSPATVWAPDSTQDMSAPAGPSIPCESPSTPDGPTERGLTAVETAASFDRANPFADPDEVAAVPYEHI